MGAPVKDSAHLIPARSRGPGVRIAARRRCRTLLQAWDVPHSLDHFETTLGSTMVVSTGKATGRPPVVVLAGAGLSAATVLAAVGAVARTHRVFVPDLPGEPGLSTARRPRRRRLHAYGRWLDEMLPQLTDEPVILAGHSLGAGIALACTPSERITGLVLLNPAGIVPVKRSFELTKLRAASLLHMHTPRTNSDRILTYLSAPRFMPDDNVIDWFSMATQYRFLGTLPRPLPARDLRRWARGVPIIVATGEQDTLFPPGRLRGPVRALLAADVQVLPRCGHLTLREFPGALTRLVESDVG
ncbi:alpha/beta hydrolase [Rhodococcus wratislaviensis]|nr:alpha/beta hydrolase [Rhodococcus sp. 3A]MBC2898100.1 alpha/beta hydrolase [Rhodococcus sp. 4CII]